MGYKDSDTLWTKRLSDEEKAKKKKKREMMFWKTHGRRDKAQNNNNNNNNNNKENKRDNKCNCEELLKHWLRARIGKVGQRIALIKYNGDQWTMHVGVFKFT